jgi:hypothetical protein
MNFGSWLWRRRYDTTQEGDLIRAIERRRLQVPWKSTDRATWIMDIRVQAPSLIVALEAAWRCYEYEAQRKRIQASRAEDKMNDTQLLRLVELAFPEMTHFDREVYAHARLRLLCGHALKPAQRQHLTRLLTIVERLRATLPQAPAYPEPEAG